MELQLHLTHSKVAGTVLVAGGAGYIGSHVCKALAQKGLLPVVLDNLVTGKRDFVKWGPLINASVSQTDAVRDVIKEHTIQAVIDLAGSIEVGESVKNPLKYYENNLAVKIPFLRTLHECGVRAFVFSSTAAVYGEPQTVPIPESHPLAPKNPYGASKLAFEQVLRDFHASSGPVFMALRYFNAAGASPEGEIGEAHDPESHLIPRACFAALGHGPALEVYGNDYPTPDKTAIRDYIHVSDLANAHLLAVDALLGGAAPAAYNLGTGIGTSVAEVLAGFKRLGWPVPHTFKPRRAGDPARLVADARAVRAALGWTPLNTKIDSVIRSAYQWHQANPLAVKSA
jgi:UDP-arabinose 4-epimerase